MLITMQWIIVQVSEKTKIKKREKNACKKKTTEMQHAQLKLAIITT